MHWFETQTGLKADDPVTVRENIIAKGTTLTSHANKRNMKQTGSNKLFLTRLGGGAFGNPSDWIMDAIAENLESFALSGLDVQIVSYEHPNPAVAKFINHRS